MNILITSKNSSLSKSLFEHLAKDNNVSYTSRSKNTSNLKCKNFINWEEINLYDFKVIVVLDSPKKDIPYFNIISQLLRLTKNALVINKYLKKNIDTSAIIFSSVSVYGNTPILDHNSKITKLTSVYGFLKILQERLVTFGCVKDRVTIMRLPAILHPKSRGHWPARLIEKLNKSADIHLYNANLEWNACISFESILNIIDHIIQGKNQNKVLIPHVENFMKIIDVVKLMKITTNSNSKIIIDKLPIIETGVRKIDARNEVHTSEIDSALRNYCYFFEKNN